VRCAWCALLLAGCAQVVGIDEIVPGECDAVKSGFTPTELPVALLQSQSVRDIVVADFNRDGDPDVVAIAPLAEGVLLWTNRTINPTKPALLPSTLVMPAPPIAIAVADLNADGRLDLVAARADGISVLINQTPALGAAIAFAPQEQELVIGTVPAVAIGDIDNDGRPDIVTMSQANVVVLRTTAVAPYAFQRLDHPFVAEQVHALSLVSLDPGGTPDVLVTAGETVLPLVNRSTPGVLDLSLQLYPGAVSTAMSKHAIADYNEDDQLDVIVAAPEPGAVMLLSNASTNAELQLIPRRLQLFNSGSVLDVRTAAVDTDGRSDLAIVTDRGIAALVDRARGFADPDLELLNDVVVASGSFTAVASADLNRDGTADVIGGTSAGIVVFSGGLVPDCEEP
jgi:hypothetical protein